MSDLKISKISKISKDFICEKCDYKCSKQSEFTKHILTLKHQTVTLDFIKSSKIYPCVCGKEYKHRQNLYTHKKTCQTLIQNETANKMIELLQQNNELLIQNQDLKEVIVEQKELIIEQKEIILEQKEERHELKEVIIGQCENSKQLLEIARENRYVVLDQAEQQTEHNNIILELTKEQLEMTKEQKEMAKEQIEQNKQLMETIKEKGLGQHITNNNTTNNTANFNFFLNNTCKDALNIDEYTSMLKDAITVEMIKYFEHSNHVEGVSNVINQTFDTLGFSKWPMHCTDISRGTVHVKVGDTWIKENHDGGIHQTKLIRNTEDKILNYMVQNKEVKKDPEVYDSIFGNVLGNKCDEAARDRDTMKIKCKISNKTLFKKAQIK
jgi:hypothetical protein